MRRIRIASLSIAAPALAVGAALLLAPAPTLAQTWTPDGGVPEANPDDATITFEEVGDFPAHAATLAFDSTGTLFAGGGDLFALPPGEDHWVELPSSSSTFVLLPLRPDTLIRASTDVERSLDGGQTWTNVFEEGGIDGLYATPSGVLLTGMPFDEPGIARSTDRGATWTPTPILGVTPNNYGAKGFLAFPSDHAAAPGRRVAGVAAGLVYSDDGGATWDTTAVWQDYRFIGESFALASDGGALATVLDGALSGVQLYGSADGASWSHLGVFHDPPDTALVGYTRLVGGRYGWSLADGSVLVVTGRGFVWRSRDGGQTWGLLDGRVPLTADGLTYVSWALVGPDGRLYVAIDRAGSSDDGSWVYRSAGVVATAQEGVPEPTGAGVSLEVSPNPFRGRTTVTLTLDRSAEVTLALYDVLGREVASLLRGRYAAGRHAVTLSGASLLAGSYVLRAIVEGGALTRRITILR